MLSTLSMPSTYPVTSHTDYVGPGSTFVAIKGYKQDGIQFIPIAVEKGAKKIVLEHNAHIPVHILEKINVHNVQLAYVADARKALAELCMLAAGNPAQKLKIIGITGTKGKTTTSFLLEHILKVADFKTALISSVKNAINGINFPAPLTTPQPDYVHQFLKLCVEQNVTYVVMEVAAQALSLHRVDGIFFDGIIFTNFSHEHLEFYTSMGEYFAEKCLIFNQIKEKAPILINGDDSWVKKLKHTLHNAYTFGHAQHNHFSAPVHTTADQISSFELKIKDCVFTFSCPALIGNFNIMNMLAAVAMGLQLGIAPETILHAIKTFKGVPGRLERYQLPNGAVGIIDYAHNPASYEVVLSTLRNLTSHLIVVFGAGGERDHAMRPLMGQCAAKWADVIIITTDNPRSENAADIAHDIMQGIPKKFMNKVLCELDRKVAIEKAYKLSKKESILVLLGKGPDEYQEIQSTKYPFSEKKIICSLS